MFLPSVWLNAVKCSRLRILSGEIEAWLAHDGYVGWYSSGSWLCYRGSIIPVLPELFCVWQREGCCWLPCWPFSLWWLRWYSHSQKCNAYSVKLSWSWLLSRRGLTLEETVWREGLWRRPPQLSDCLSVYCAWLTVKMRKAVKWNKPVKFVLKRMANHCQAWKLKRNQRKRGEETLHSPQQRNLQADTASEKILLRASWRK